MNNTNGRLPDALIDSLADDLAPVAPLRMRTGLAWVLLAAVATVLLVLVMDGFWHGILTGEASVPYFLANGMLGILGGSSAFAVVRMASPQVGNSQEGARWSAAMLALLPLTALLILGVNGLATAIRHDHAGPDCFLAGIGFGLITAAALVLWLRKGAPVSLTAAGSLTGVAAGAIGSCAYGLACPVDTIAHLGIWHVAPVALLGLVGRYAIPPLVRW